jgi:hypothetical protein
VSNKSQANQKAKSALGTLVTFPNSFLKDRLRFYPGGDATIPGTRLDLLRTISGDS